MNAIHLDPKLVPSSLRGSYSGKTFKAIVTETVTIPADAGLWNDGSRDSYSGIMLESGRSFSLGMQAAAPWDNSRRELTVNLAPGQAIVRSSMFCGSDMGLTFYVHPQNAAALLPAPSAELTDHEKIVLEATCSLKSSYGGRDRYQMACCDHLGNPYGTLPKMTRDDWNAAKASLQTKGLLNKAGAITVAGKNARK
jgi:hypothetical protein